MAIKNQNVAFSAFKCCDYILTQAISGTVLKSDELYMFNVTSLQWTRIKLSNDVPSLRSGAQLTPGAAGVYMFGGKDEE